MHLNKPFVIKIGLAEYITYSPHPISSFSAEDAEGDFDVDEDA